MVIILKRLKRMYYTFKAKKIVASYGDFLYVNGKSSFTRQTHIGNNTHFNGMTVSGGGKVTIGNNFHSGKYCQIISQNHNYEGTALPYDNSYITKDVTINDNVWVGNNVIILGGVTIGEGAIVQAGAVVVKDIPDCALVGGNPAKVFKYRNITHYENLKEKGNFN
ncbi:acyltransferase [Aerococcus urinaeequi]|uniref:Acyltransferase n=1 Tax=Aerococcus urinaeequi TaxID=51665 RepID=A0AAF0BDX2_9LACT|nr:acyltransferase [Aerococcus urinaeequi]WCG37228.1 acyltransferase [Aerococcus urinaeequi]